MSDRVPIPKKSLVLAASALALVLAGCSGRDSNEAEKIARVEAAADRAEDAAKRAEAAARQLPAPPEEPAAAEEPAEPEQQSDDSPTEPEPA